MRFFSRQQPVNLQAIPSTGTTTKTWKHICIWCGIISGTPTQKLHGKGSLLRRQI